MSNIQCHPRAVNKLRVPVEMLRSPLLPATARLQLFFAALGGQTDGYVPQWSVAQVAQICGITVATARRAMAALRAEGHLRRVNVGGYHTQQANLPPIPQEALDGINAKTNLVRYVGRDWVPELDPLALPDIPSYVVPGGRAWVDVCPALVRQITDPDVWGFWTVKLPSTLTGNDHPLRKIDDPNLRVHLALASVTRGWGITSPPEPQHPDRLLLATAKTRVGRGEFRLSPEEDQAARAAYQDWVTGGRRQGLRDYLRDLLARQATSVTPVTPGPADDFDFDEDDQNICFDSSILFDNDNPAGYSVIS